MIGEGYCWCPYVPTNLDKNNYFIDERGGVWVVTPPSPPIWQKTAIEKARKQGVESLTEDEVNRLQSLGVEFIILEDESRVYLRKS